MNEWKAEKEMFHRAINRLSFVTRRYHARMAVIQVINLNWNIQFK